MESNWKKEVKAASRKLNLVSEAEKDKILLSLADAVAFHKDTILSENRKDLAEMDRLNPMYDRLMLTEERLEGIAADIRNVAGLPSPLGRLLSQTVRPNGM